MAAAPSIGSPSKRFAPGPRSWPLIGNVGALRGLLPFMMEQWDEHGDVFRIQLAGMSAVAVVHPDLMSQVLLTKRQNFVKGSVLDSVRSILGDGLVTLEGEAWKERRTLAQPAFHRQSLEKLTTVMAESGARYFERLAARLGPGGGELDMHPEFVRLTLDVVVSALFGEGTIDTEEISYEALGHALELVSDSTNGFRLPAFIPTPHNVKLKRTLRELNRNVYTIIETARKIEGGNGSLLSMLLDARDESGSALPSKAVRDEVITLFMAGHETTALTLTWLLALLDGRPDVLTEMREEVESVLGGRDPTFDDVPKLVYLRQVVDETLRLRPAAPMVGRNVVEDDRLGGYDVARGDVVLPFIWGVHRHRDFWTNPEQFDPERFAGGSSKLRHKWSYLPFSGGPRVCIGNAFSLVETVVLVAQMLNRFDIEVQSCADVKPVAIATVRPDRPVRVKFKPRPG
jgi:cytochrome P450